MARLLLILACKFRRIIMALSVIPPIQDSAAGLLEASSTDVDEHCAALGRWRLRYDQISAGVIEVARAPVARLRAHLEAIHEAIATAPERFEDPAVRQALEDALLVEIMDMLPTARPTDPGRSANARKRTVDRARELMHGNGNHSLSLLEVCKAVGASPRKLGYCFQAVLGTSPMHYWRAMRLNRVRRDLKRAGGAGTSIYDVAVQHGFWHFSQFSLDYKRHFAELPSETLRRARRAA
ncbi:helix-turn-helix domain-containing protein [Bradyrhizobium diversitatis]